MDHVHCGGVLNCFFATVKQIIIAKVYLWHFTEQIHNRSFLLWGYHPLPLLPFTHWPCFVPRHNLCHSSHSANISTELVSWWCVCCVCWTEVNLLEHPDVCFGFLLTCQCDRGHCIEASPVQHLSPAGFTSPTKQANKKDIYTHRDHFCLRATPQPKTTVSLHPARPTLHHTRLG